jgi:hypothetical protein
MSVGGNCWGRGEANRRERGKEITGRYIMKSTNNYENSGRREKGRLRECNGRMSLFKEQCMHLMNLLNAIPWYY